MMYEADDYSEKEEKEIKRRVFSYSYFGSLLALGFNLLFYVVGLIGALALESLPLLICSWVTAGFVLVECILIAICAYFFLNKAHDERRSFTCNVLKSIARCMGFAAGVTFVVYGVLSFGGAPHPGSYNGIGSVLSAYGAIAILAEFPMFIYSVTHLSLTASWSLPSHGQKATKAKNKKDETVVDDVSSSYSSSQQSNNSTDNAIEVEVHDINKA